MCPSKERASSSEYEQATYPTVFVPVLGLEAGGGETLERATDPTAFVAVLRLEAGGRERSEQYQFQRSDVNSRHSDSSVSNQNLSKSCDVLGLHLHSCSGDPLAQALS